MYGILENFFDFVKGTYSARPMRPVMSAVYYILPESKDKANICEAVESSAYISGCCISQSYTLP